MVFLLQGVHHPLPGVRPDFPPTRMKAADLTDERKLEKNEMQWLRNSEVLESQQRGLNMLNSHSLKAKAPQTHKKKSLKKTKRVAGHTLFASAQDLSLKSVQEDFSSSKSESHIYQELPFNSPDLSF